MSLCLSVRRGQYVCHMVSVTCDIRHRVVHPLTFTVFITSTARTNNDLLFCREVFSQGLPDEYAFVTTFKFRKTSRREDWYLWQIYDKYGIPQVGQ